MKNRLILVFVVMVFWNGCNGQNSSSTDTTIIYHINDNVKNSEEEYFVEISETWKTYLNSNSYVRPDGEYWSHGEYVYPDMMYISLLLHLRSLRQEGGKIQCSIVGIVPVLNDYYLLKTVFLEEDESQNNLVNIKFIVSVYAKKENGKYKFYCGTQYHKETGLNQKIGRINYIIHPEHTFSNLDAIKMDSVNTQIAALFEVEPLSFDYVVANDTRDLSELTGLNFFSYSYQPVASGGMADNYNNIIYAGNNSAFYPHEVVHLYTKAKFSNSYHSWVDEGIAALIGGSTGYDIEWHWEKLRRFLIENPDYKIDDLAELQTLIPNGEYITDFRYPIGAIICQRIIDKEGMQGIFEALQVGRTDDNYFKMLEDKLNIKRNEFGEYVKTEILKLDPIDDEKLKKLKY